MAQIEIYTKDYCPYCKRAKALFDSKGVTYTDTDLMAHPEQRDIMIERANGGSTVPQIFIDGQHIGGCDDLLALDAKGELAKLLG